MRCFTRSTQHAVMLESSVLGLDAAALCRAETERRSEEESVRGDLQSSLFCSALSPPTNIQRVRIGVLPHDVDALCGLL